MNTVVKPASNWVPFLIVVAFVLVALSVVVGTKQATEERIDKKRARQQAYHDVVMATTNDVSRGSGLVRIRQATVRTSDGACTTTVQRYVRNSTNDLFLGPPSFETFQCSGATM